MTYSQHLPLLTFPIVAIDYAGSSLRRSISAFAVLSVMAFQVGAAEDKFGQPSRLCSALVSEGLVTEDWMPSKSFPGKWVCLTTLVPFGPGGVNGMANNIAFYVNGTAVNRASDLTIKININNAGERTQAFARLESATKNLFKALAQPMPPELAKSLAQQKPVEVRAPFGKAELILEPGRIDSFKVVLTDGMFLAATERIHNSSVKDFESCKTVVAKAAGYSMALLSGDGNPLQESSHKSFLFKGRNDVFFCEVYPDRRYKVKALLNGNIPFRYISEGNL